MSPEDLKLWYEALGFAVTGTKRFEHLPLVVCYLEKRLSLSASPSRPGRRRPAPRG
jgi:hypothetical protein